jgi:hypothetical protein
MTACIHSFLQEHKVIEIMYVIIQITVIYWDIQMKYSKVYFTICRHSTPISPTNKTDRHDIAELLLKMMLTNI